MTKECTRNERIRCCLYIETAPDPPNLRGLYYVKRSNWTLESSHWMRSEWQQWSTNAWNDRMMIRITIWNDRMMVEWDSFWNQGFCLGSKIALHFTSFHHSKAILEQQICIEWIRNEWNGRGMIHIHCIFSFFTILNAFKWHGNDWMRRNGSVFEDRIKIWILKNI